MVYLRAERLGDVPPTCSGQSLSGVHPHTFTLVDYRFLLALMLAVGLALPATAQKYVPAFDRISNFNIGTGTEVILVYFGASTCRPCYSVTWLM